MDIRSKITLITRVIFGFLICQTMGRFYVNVWVYDLAK